MALTLPNPNSEPHLFFKGRRLTGFTMLKASTEDRYLYFMRSYRVEYKYINFLKKILKAAKPRLSPRSRNFLVRLYVSLKNNYTISKKSKNARMGKGKGSFVREAIKVKKFKPFIYTSGCCPTVLKKISHALLKRANIESSCFTSIETGRLYSWGSNKKSYIYSIPNQGY